MMKNFLPRVTLSSLEDTYGENGESNYIYNSRSQTTKQNLAEDLFKDEFQEISQNHTILIGNFLLD